MQLETHAELEEKLKVATQQIQDAQQEQKQIELGVQTAAADKALDLDTQLKQTRSALEERMQHAEATLKASTQQLEQHEETMEELAMRIGTCEKVGSDLVQDLKEEQEFQEQWHLERAQNDKEAEAWRSSVNEKLEEIQGAKDELETLNSRLDSSLDAIWTAVGANDLRDELEASKAEVVQLGAKLDGSLDALFLRLETERWVREGVDKVADGVSSQFLRLLDEASQKAETRMAQCEERLTKLGG